VTLVVLVGLVDAGDDAHRLLTEPSQEPVAVADSPLPLLVVESHLPLERRTEGEGRVRQRRQPGVPNRLPVIGLCAVHSHNVTRRRQPCTTIYEFR